MKTASTLIQFATLSVLLAMHIGAPDEFRMPGVRKALQTISAVQGQPVLPDLTIDAGI